MPVPTAVTQRRQRDEADLRAQGIDPTSGAPVDIQVANAGSTPPAPAPVVVPTPTPTPSPTESPDAMVAANAKIAELTQALRTAEGRTSSSAHELEELRKQNQALSDNRGFLEKRLSEQATQLQEMQAALDKIQDDRTSAGVSAAVGALEEVPLTDEERKEYEHSVPVIEKVVKRVVGGAIKSIVERLQVLEKSAGKVKEIEGTLPKLAQSVEESERTRVRNEEEAFVQREIVRFYPDFPTVRESKEWKAYLASDVGGGKGPVGAWLRTYRVAQDANAIRALIDRFYQARDKQPTLDTLAVPGKTGADAPEKPVAPKIKASDYQRNLKLYTFKKMPKADWEAFRARWDEAYAAGNVDMDVELR